jgi:leucine dehydrogenase
MTTIQFPAEIDEFATFEHEQLVITTGSRSGVSITVAVHSTRLGAALGGCRLWSYPHWRAGTQDAMRLAAAMTVKCAVAGLPTGGGKAVLALAEGEQLDDDRRRAVFLDLGDIVEMLGGRYRTAEDVGTTSADMHVVRERTQHVLGLPAEHGGIGEPAEPTALGVYESLRSVLKHLTGSGSVQDKRFTIIGLGQVGYRLAARLSREGAAVTATDVDRTKAQLAASINATWVDTAAAALELETDIVVPAGVGGLLTRDTVNALTCRAIVGPANNQLASPQIADILAERNILWAPDFVVNAGGALFAILAGEHRLDEGQVRERVIGIGHTVADLLATSERLGVTPVQAAYQLAAQRLSGS